MLDVRRMRVLREVAVRGSFSAAAEALSFTQSAVSQQIAALEREAGTILVQRGARGVRLTEAGEALRGPAAPTPRPTPPPPWAPCRGPGPSGGPSGACGAAACAWPRSSPPARP